MCHFRAQNGPIILNKKILVQTIINFKKFLQRIQSYAAPFLGLKWPICPKQKYFLENYYHSHLPISRFHYVKFFKNSSHGSRVMRMHKFWAQNSSFPQMRIFSENLSMSTVSFIRAYLHAKNQSQILIYS